MRLIIGLGPIGGNIGARLAELGRPVVGLDLDPARAVDWSRATGAPGVTDFDAVDWDEVDTVIIAVRLADQVTSVLEAIRSRRGDGPLTVYVVTTLSIADARRIMPSAPDAWRMFEAPVSGGPRGARDGTMTVFLAGPERTESDDALLADIAGRVFTADSYGGAAVMKLTNNTLGALNAISTAHMMRIAVDNGVPAKDFLEIIGVSSGQSWMSDNFTEFHDDLLFKDARLLLTDLGTLPVTDLSPEFDLSADIAAARSLLADDRSDVATHERLGQ